jgi:hypothetical protein
VVIEERGTVEGELEEGLSDTVGHAVRDTCSLPIPPVSRLSKIGREAGSRNIWWGGITDLAEGSSDFDGCELSMFEGIEQFTCIIVFSDVDLFGRQNPTGPG